MSEYSQSRNEARILEAVNTLIVSGAIKNSKLNRLVTISRLTLSKDNAYATLFVSYMLDDDKVLNSSVTALQNAAPFIQGRLGQILKTRNTPKLKFLPDTSQREAERINTILESLVSEEK